MHADKERCCGSCNSNNTRILFLRLYILTKMIAVPHSIIYSYRFLLSNSPSMPIIPDTITAQNEGTTYVLKNSASGKGGDFGRLALTTDSWAFGSKRCSKSSKRCRDLRQSSELCYEMPGAKEWTHLLRLWEWRRMPVSGRVRLSPGMKAASYFFVQIFIIFFLRSLLP